MRSLFTITLVLLPALLLGQKKVNFQETPVNFTVKNAGFNVNGSIGGLDGFVTLEDNGASPIKIEGTIDPNTIRTGIGLRDTHLKKPEYFNVKEYPKIRMTSTDIKKKGKNKYIGKFSLTIKDVSKDIEIPFTFSASGAGYVLKGEFTINRIDYKVGEGSLTLSDHVKIKIDFKATDQK